MITLLTVIGCRDEVKSVVHKDTAPDVPTVISHNVKTLISDSGVTQYRITTKLWQIYSEAAKPYWYFPEGLYLAQFDKQFKVIATVRCDSAMYDTQKQLWQLDGNVRIQNVKKELILTNQLFWDQRWQEVRSDSFVHIERIDRAIEG